MTPKVRYFKPGSRLYNCAECGKTTRETGQGESLVGLCARCAEIAEINNAYADGDMDEVEHARALAAVKGE